MGEWLIYRRPEDFMRSYMISDLVAMEAKEYDHWADIVSHYERGRFTVVARGLTQEQAEKMIELTKENRL